MNGLVKCEKCNCRPRYKDKKWCKYCIAIWQRKQELSELKAENIIYGLVETLYWQASLQDIPDDILLLISNLNDNDLFVFGPVGRGKTHLLAALIRHYVYEGYNVERINFDDFCLEIRSTYHPASKITERNLIEPLKTLDLLVIDDLGLRSQQESEFVYTTFYTILNKRQERKLPTFLSSNKSIAQLERTFDSRIASRLRSAVVIEIQGQDRRK